MFCPKYLFLSICVFLFSCQKNNPELLAPGQINTPDSHESINYITENGDSIYFTRASKNYSSSNIMLAVKTPDGWTAQKLFPQTDQDYNADFTILPSGNLAFFTSKQSPIDSIFSDEWNIWSIQKINGGWDINSKSIVSRGINSDAAECCLKVNSNGDIYFASERANSWDIYSAKWTGQKAENIERVQNLSSDKMEWPSFISNDNTFLLMSSIRPDGIGGDDIYYSIKSGKNWSSPILLDTLFNTSQYEDSALYKEGQLYFSSKKSAPNFSEEVSNIYVIPYKF